MYLRKSKIFNERFLQLGQSKNYIFAKAFNKSAVEGPDTRPRQNLYTIQI